MAASGPIHNSPFTVIILFVEDARYGLTQSPQHMKQLKHDINNYAHRHAMVRAVVDFQQLKSACFDESVIQNEEDMTPLTHKRVDHQQRFFVIDTRAWMQGGYTPDYQFWKDFVRDTKCGLVICGVLDKSSYFDFSEIFAADFSTWDRRRECNAMLIRMKIEMLLLVEAHKSNTAPQPNTRGAPNHKQIYKGHCNADAIKRLAMFLILVTLLGGFLYLAGIDKELFDFWWPRCPRLNFACRMFMGFAISIGFFEVGFGCFGCASAWREDSRLQQLREKLREKKLGSKIGRCL